MNYSKLRLYLAVIILLSFLGASLLRLSGFFIHDIYRLQESLGGDRATHFIMGVGLMVAGLLITWTQTILKPSATFLLIFSLVFMEEISQHFIATRKFNWLDLQMGLFGSVLVYCGACVYMIIASQGKRSIKE